MLFSSVLQGIFPREHNKSNHDTVQDVLLLLYLMDKPAADLSGKTPLLAKIKLLKLVFLAEKEMVEKRLKGFNFFFNIYKRGPSSKELLRMIDDLRAQGLIAFDEAKRAFVVTEKGKELVQEFSASVQDNTQFYSVIDSIIEKFGALTPEQILDKVYSMEISPMYSTDKINIGQEVAKSSRRRLLMKLQPSEATKELSVPEEWVETVNYVMNPEFA